MPDKIKLALSFLLCALAVVFFCAFSYGDILPYWAATGIIFMSGSGIYCFVSYLADPE